MDEDEALVNAYPYRTVETDYEKLAAEDAAGQLLQGLSPPLQGGVEGVSEVDFFSGALFPEPFFAEEPL